MAILEALRIFLPFDDKLVMESNSTNAISRNFFFPSVMGPWKYHFHLSEIKLLFSSIWVEFKHVGQLPNGMADSLAKHGWINHIVWLLSLRNFFGCFVLV